MFATVCACKISLLLLDVRYLQSVRVFCPIAEEFGANWRSGHLREQERSIPLNYGPERTPSPLSSPGRQSDRGLNFSYTYGPGKDGYPRNHQQ